MVSSSFPMNKKNDGLVNFQRIKNKDMIQGLLLHTTVRKPDTHSYYKDIEY